MRVLVIALFAVAAHAAQASVVDRKRAGRDLQDDITAADNNNNKAVKYKGEVYCGTLFAPPCEDTGCAPGLILDAVGWSDLLENGFFEQIDTCNRRLNDESSDRQWERKLVLEPGIFQPVCAPCGALGQLPCAPCEGECVPKCSEGLVATNIIGYIDSDGPCRRRLGPECEKIGDCMMGLTPDLIALNFCAPCGADGQPPCDDTGCLPGHIPVDPEESSFLAVAKCAKCGKASQPVCEDGCNPGTVASASGKCKNCGGVDEPCCCNSNEFDEVYRQILYSSASEYSGINKETLLASVIQSASADPTKCLKGCKDPSSGPAYRCGVENVCYDPST